MLLSVAARFVRSLAWRLGLSAGAGALVLAAGGAAPSYAAPFVWSGGAPPGQGQWSKPANWAGGVAPSGTVEQLSFPAPTSVACNVTPPSQPTLTCLQGTNDLSGLRTESLSIDNGYAYDLTGEPLTLGAGGLTAASSNTSTTSYGDANLRIPLVLAASQTWTLNGGRLNHGVSLGATVTGGSSALRVQLADQATLWFQGDTELGPVTIAGSGGNAFFPGTLLVGGGIGTSGALNASDGNPITVEGGVSAAVFSGATGPLTMTGGQLQVGCSQTCATTPITVNGALKLNGGMLSESLAQGGGNAFALATLNVAGKVILNRPKLLFFAAASGAAPGPGCPSLAPGPTYTLLSAPAIEGHFEEFSSTGPGPLPNGATVPINTSVPCAQSRVRARITMTQRTITATLVPASPEGAVFGRSAGLQVVSGVVLVQLPGARGFTRLNGGETVPVGTVIDTLHGTVRLTSAREAGSAATQSGLFHAGTFRFTQARRRTPFWGSRPVGVTDLTLTGPTPRSCVTVPRVTTSRRSTVRRLWGSGKGRYRSVGQNAAAGVRGTHWLTEDTCAGTLIRVVTGVVSVEDFPHHRSFLLRAPHSFLAHRGPGG